MRTIRSQITFEAFKKSLFDLAKRKMDDYTHVQGVVGDKVVDMAFYDETIRLEIVEAVGGGEVVRHRAKITPYRYQDGNALRVECYNEKSMEIVTDFIERTTGVPQEIVEADAATKEKLKLEYPKRIMCPIGGEEVEAQSFDDFLAHIKEVHERKAKRVVVTAHGEVAEGDGWMLMPRKLSEERFGEKVPNWKRYRDYVEKRWG